MQNTNGCDLIAPRSNADPVMEARAEGIVVLAGQAGVAIGDGRLLAGESSRGPTPVLRPFDIPVVGANGEVSGILRSFLPDASWGDLSASFKSNRRSSDEITKCVVHDMNNLLAVIDGGLRLLERQSDANVRKAVFSHLRGAVDRGTILTRSLLSCENPARNGHAGTTPQQLSVAVEALRPCLSPDTLMEIAIEPDLWTIKVDPDDLYFALLNLCRNADAATCKGGVIVISAKNVIAQSVADSGMIAITIQDNGSGMTDEVMGRACEPYFTTKNAGVGSGLGLAQVRSLVERQGGSIRLQSELGVGTAIQLIFPRTAAEKTASSDRRSNGDDSCSISTPPAIPTCRHQTEASSI